MIVAVTGATGTVGRFLLNRLTEEGAKVRAWRRATSDPAGLPQGIEWIEGALGAPEAAETLVAGADALVHAALDHVPGRFRGGEGGDPERFLTTNVDGSLMLMEAARRAGVGRCIVFSSRAVFGAPYVDAPIGDDEPPRPDTHYGAAKAALEDAVRGWGKDGAWTVAALRPTGVYGLVEPVARSKWFDIVTSALKGEAVAPRAASEVHGRDVAEAVWRLLNADAAAIAGRAFNCSDIVVSTRDIVARVQEVAGVSGPLPDEAAAPKNVMRCDGLAALGMRFGGMPLFRETVAELVEGVRARGR